MKQITTVILRLGGVITVFIGLILTTDTIVHLAAANSVVSNFPDGMPRGMEVKLQGVVAQIGNWALIARASIIGWGIILLALAKSIAGLISPEEVKSNCQKNESQQAAAQRTPYGLR